MKNSKRGRLDYEFPDYDLTDYPNVPRDWKSTHWHNDTCPSYRARGSDEIFVRVFIDYRDPDKREIAGPRFGAAFHDEKDGTQDLIVETDDWNELLAKVAAFVFPE